MASHTFEILWRGVDSTAHVRIAEIAGVEVGFIVKGRHGWLWSAAGQSGGDRLSREDAMQVVVARVIATPRPSGTS